MKIEKITNITRGQDGAIWGRYLFRFQVDASCSVYDLENLKTTADDEQQPTLCRFFLDKIDVVKPHCNSVFFGSEYYDNADEFPLLYSNVYNNYAKEADPMKGVCCVYRLQRKGNDFSTTLVQLIRIGFTEDEKLWKSSACADRRPYGNFAVDREKGIYYAFTMCDGPCCTRYFAFRLPRLADGRMDERFGVPVVTLEAEDILETFESEYQQYMQGACIHKGKVYTLEGLANDPQNQAMRVIDLQSKQQESYTAFLDYGLNVEPELIDFKGDTCYYADNLGSLYCVSDF